MKKIFISLLICSCTALLVYANDIPTAGVGIVLQDVNNQISVQKLLPHSNMGTVFLALLLSPVAEKRNRMDFSTRFL